MSIADFEESIKKMEEQAKIEQGSSQKSIEHSEQPTEELKEQVAESLEQSQEQPQEQAVEAEAEAEEEEDIEMTDNKAHKAFAKMRYNQKQLREQLEKSEREKQEIRERLAKLEGANEVRHKPEIREPEIVDKEPDKTYDREAWLEWKARQLEKKQQEIEARVNQNNQLSLVDRARNELRDMEQDYTVKNKISDYDSRLKFIRDKEAALIRLRHPAATEAQIQQHLNDEKIRIASDAVKSGKHPAEIFIKMAEELGYAKPKEEYREEKKQIPVVKLNQNMRKNTSLIGSSNVEKTGPMSSDQLVGKTLREINRSYGELDKLIENARYGR